MKHYDIETEKRIISMMAYDNDCLNYGLIYLTPEMFFDEDYKIYFEAIQKESALNSNVSAVSIYDRAKLIKPDIYSSKLGSDDLPSLRELKGLIPKLINIYYLRELRKLSLYVQDLTEVEGRLSSDEMLKDIELAFIKVLSKKTNIESISLKDSNMKALKHISDMANGKLNYLKTGYEKLDKLIVGLQPGTLTTLAARPSIGKSAFSMSLALKIADKNPVDFFSFEMSCRQLSFRSFAESSGVNFFGIQSGNVKPEESELINDAAIKLDAKKLYINDTGGMGIDALCSRIRINSLHRKTKLVIIDHLSYISADERASAKSYRNQEIEVICKRLREIGKQMNIPIILLSQLNRGVESREDKRPVLSDLRDSGAIEQDSDMVWMLYREDYYRQDEENYIPDNILNLYIRKNRDGKLGKIDFYFQKDIMRITELEEHGKYLKEF